MRPFVAFLTGKGADYVKARTDLPAELLRIVRPVAGGLPWTVPKLRERYLVNEVRIRVAQEVQQDGLITLVSSIDERTMRRTTVVEKYRQGVSPATTSDQSSSAGKISELGK